MLDPEHMCAEVAVRNHMHVCPDDPAFALVTLVQLTLEASAGRLDDQFRASIAELQRSVQKVETRAGHVLAERVKDSANQFSSELQVELNAAGRKIADELVRSVTVRNQSAAFRWLTIGLLTGVAIFTAGIWFGIHYVR